jgi:hypothetical protein
MESGPVTYAKYPENGSPVKKVFNLKKNSRQRKLMILLKTT